MLKNKKGFSLIELIVVIAILGVLAGIAAPNIIGAINNARINSDLANATTIANAVLKAIAMGETGKTSDSNPYTYGIALENKKVSDLTWLIPEHLNNVPQVRLTSALHSSDDANFYVSISADGQVTVSAKTSASDYTQLYPTPAGAWATSSGK